jgi:hypothetical protein
MLDITTVVLPRLDNTVPFPGEQFHRREEILVYLYIVDESSDCLDNPSLYLQAAWCVQDAQRSRQ